MKYPKIRYIGRLEPENVLERGILRCYSRTLNLSGKELLMAHRKRNGKLSWRSKKANHGSMPTRGKEKRWGKKAKSTK